MTGTYYNLETVERIEDGKSNAATTLGPEIPDHRRVASGDPRDSSLAGGGHQRGYWSSRWGRISFIKAVPRWEHHVLPSPVTTEDVPPTDATEGGPLSCRPHPDPPEHSRGESVSALGPGH